MLPVMMRSRLTFLQIADHIDSFCCANHGTQANAACVCLRDHHLQSTGHDLEHVITFGAAVEVTVADLFDDAYTVVRINNLLSQFEVHTGCTLPRNYIKNSRPWVGATSRLSKQNPADSLALSDADCQPNLAYNRDLCFFLRSIRLLILAALRSCAMRSCSARFPQPRTKRIRAVCFASSSFFCAN